MLCSQVVFRDLEMSSYWNCQPRLRDPHSDEYKLLSDRQNGFLKKHSCETQLLTVINDLAKILNKGWQIDTCILDIEKAYDTFLVNYLNVNYMTVVLVERL